MYSLIGTLTHDPAEFVTLPDGSLPLPCVVEDEDGVRLLLLDETRVPVDLWDYVVREYGAPSAIICTTVWAWMFGEDFTEHHVSDGRTHYLPEYDFWHQADGPLTYREMVIARQQEEVEAATIKGFVPLHVHGEHSAFDGLSKVEEIVSEVVGHGQQAVALTDHGVCSGHYDFQSAAVDRDVKPIFGIEAYFVEDRFWRPDKGERDDYNHLILWAMDDEGLRNLWAMSTEGFRDGFYNYPRIDWDTLTRFNTGVMASTACLRGPVADYLLEGDEERARMKLGRLLDLFGDRLYAEIQTNGLPDQIKLNERLVVVARDLGIPLIVATDSHYPTQDRKPDHEVWMAMQTNSDLLDETGLFEGSGHYGMMSEPEVRKALSTFGEDVVDEAVANTVAIAERCTARIPQFDEPPVYSRGESKGSGKDADRLMELCLDNWKRKLGTLDDDTFEVFAKRFEREMSLLIEKRFCGYFLMVADYARWAKTNGILVGPGRGSGGGSLVAYLSDITEINPIEADLMFERFLTEGRDALPDFDLDFPATKRGMLQEHLRERWGEDYVVRVGTHLRYKSKGIIRKLASVLDSTTPVDFRDMDKMSTIIDAAEADTAGLGLPWEDLWEAFGDLTHAEATDRGGGDEDFTLDVARGRYPKLFEYADALVGRLHAYGKHPAGFVISTSVKLTEHLPLRLGEDEPGFDAMITQYDMDAVERMGFVKFDLLTLRTLDTIQQAVDLIEQNHGVRVDPYDWASLPHDDGEVWDNLSAGNVLGVFQIEKVAGQQMCQRLKPRSIADLAAVITLIRPGPVRSGLTEMYLARRRGDEPVIYPHPLLEDVLDRTYGCMIYQEDIMATCQVVAGYDLGEADEVRRILGKKKVELVEAEGKRFVSRAVERGIDQEVADDLWRQMGEFARYGFNRAHAWGYALLGYWCAWLKVRYPTEWFTAVLSTVPKDRLPLFVREAKSFGISVLPPDINESGRGFSAGDGVVRYGFDSIKGVGEAATNAIIAGQPYRSWEEFWEYMGQKGVKVNAGHVSALAGVGTFDSLFPNRRALEVMLEREKSGDAERCVFKDDDHRGPNDLPCHFDWASEPLRIGKRGRPLKAKPPPKRCTKGCRNYTPPAPLQPGDVEPYTARQIRDREREMLGVYLSSTPFDDVPADVWEDEDVADVATLTEPDARGDYLIIGMLTKRRPYTDRADRAMGFLGFELREGETLEVVSFHKTWALYKDVLRKDDLYVALVARTSRGFQLKELLPL